MTDILGTKLVLKSGKLYGNTPRLEPNQDIFLMRALNVGPGLTNIMIRLDDEVPPH